MYKIVCRVLDGKQIYGYYIQMADGRTQIVTLQEACKLAKARVIVDVKLVGDRITGVNNSHLRDLPSRQLNDILSEKVSTAYETTRLEVRAKLIYSDIKNNMDGKNGVIAGYVIFNAGSSINLNGAKLEYNCETQVSSKFIDPSFDKYLVGARVLKGEGPRDYYIAASSNSNIRTEQIGFISKDTGDWDIYTCYDIWVQIYAREKYEELVKKLSQSKGKNSIAKVYSEYSKVTEKIHNKEGIRYG